MGYGAPNGEEGVCSGREGKAARLRGGVSLELRLGVRERDRHLQGAGVCKGVAATDEECGDVQAGRSEV